MKQTVTSPLPPALSGEHSYIDDPQTGRLSLYAHIEPDAAKARPLLLIHSVNAAGSAYEIKPVYDHFLGSRPVYALELPGFGRSDRSDRNYTPRLMTDAILRGVGELRSRHQDMAIDALSLSLGSEFLARAAAEQPQWFHTIAMVSPTGFKGTTRRDGPPGSTRGMPWLYAVFTRPPWSQAVYNALTKRSVVRFFLNKAWGSKNIDEGLLDYSTTTTNQPGAMHAPYHFLSGNLFSNDITRVYEALTMPVFMTHGDRGDFVDYRGVGFFADNPRWEIHPLEAGALPYFEIPETFFNHYDAFLHKHAESAQPLTDQSKE